MGRMSAGSYTLKFSSLKTYKDPHNFLTARVPRYIYNCLVEREAILLFH